MWTNSTKCDESCALMMWKVYKPTEDILCFVYLFSLSVLLGVEIAPNNSKQLKTSPSA